MSDKPDFDIAERQYAEIRDLTAKLKAAEAEVQSLSTQVIILTNRAQAAEAEVESQRMQVVSHLNRIAELESYAHDLAETQDRLQAEVARMTQQLDDLGHRYAGVESSLHGANARIAELEAAGRELIRTQKEAIHAATEAALEFTYDQEHGAAAGTARYDTGKIEFVNAGIKALLGEGQ